MAIATKKKKGVGAPTCKICAIRPTFELEPCHHTICYDCYLDADEDLWDFCGICHDEIEAIIELVHATPTVDRFVSNLTTIAGSGAQVQFAAMYSLPGTFGAAFGWPVKALPSNASKGLTAGDPLFSLGGKSQPAPWTDSSTSTFSPSLVDEPLLLSSAAAMSSNMSQPPYDHFFSPSRANQRNPQVWGAPPSQSGQSSTLPVLSNMTNGIPSTAPPVQAPMPAQAPYDNGYGYRHPQGYPPQFNYGLPANAQSYLGPNAYNNGSAPYGEMHPGYGSNAPQYSQYGQYGPPQGFNYGYHGNENVMPASGMNNPQYLKMQPQVPEKTRGRRSSDVADLIRTGAIDVPDQDAMPDPRGRTDRRSSSNAPPTPQRSNSRTRSTSIEQAMKKMQLGSTSISSTTKDGDIRGNTVAFVGLEEKPLPEWFEKLASGYKPTVKEVFEALPVIEGCRSAAPSNAGVIVIRNIPYATPRSEITAFVGRNAQVIGQPDGSPYYGVHIIMERHSGKTMDSFVEFAKASEAMFVVNTLRRRTDQGRPPKIGDRVVEVEISSQQELMETLFPRAKNVVWEGAIPQIVQDDEQFYQGVQSTGFTGFLQDEEIVHMSKHAETPQRSPFAQRCLIRCYESLISTLHKYPWYAIDHVNMTERIKLYDATYTSVRALVSLLRKIAYQPQEPNKPTQTTLQELIIAVLTCPGFSEKQKAAVAAVAAQGGYSHLCGSRGMNLRFGGVFPLAHNWPFRVLIKNPKVNEHLLEYFAHLLRQGTNALQKLSLVEQHAIAASGAGFQPFGHVLIEYGSAKTMAQVGRCELNFVEKVLRHVLEGGELDDAGGR